MTAEHGSVSIVVAGVAGLGLVLSLLVVDVAHVVAARSQLATAADAAALAAAPETFGAFGSDAGPAQAAAAIALANGVVLEVCECPTDRTWAPRRVRVSVARDVDLILLGSRRLRASAMAEFRPVALVER